MNHRNRKPDRLWNDIEEGQIYYGYDDGQGNTDWYDQRGYFDSCTSTPTDEEQAINDSSWDRANFEVLGKARLF